MPAPAWMASLNETDMVGLTTTLVAPGVGDWVTMAGGVVSPVSAVIDPPNASPYAPAEGELKPHPPVVV